MLYEQTRIDIEPGTKRGRKLKFEVWQPETQCKPWLIQVSGWQRTYIDIVLYHEDINERGRASFAKVKAPTAKRFVEFVSSQLQLFSRFERCSMEFRPIDILALYEGYEKG